MLTSPSSSSKNRPTGLVASINNNKYVVKLVAAVRKVIFYDFFLTSMILMILFTIVSFLPLAFSESINSVEYLEGSTFVESLLSNEYKMWLLVTIFVMVPMLFDILLNFQNIFGTKVEKYEWISSFILAVALILPNIVFYNLVTYQPHMWSLGQVQVSLFTSQQIFVLGSLFCRMFGHAMINMNNGNDLFVMATEERTVYFLATFLLARIFFLITEVTTGNHMPFLILWYICAASAVLQVLYMLFQLLPFLGKQTEGWRFASHLQMNDFLHLLAILFYIVATVIAGIYTRRWIKPDACHTTVPKLTIFLFIQITLVYMLTAIPGRCYMRLGEIKQMKLETRLNLIRYVSHEMRSPLNIAAQGLLLINASLADLKTSITAITSVTNNSSSNNIRNMTERHPENSTNIQNDRGRVQKNSGSDDLDPLGDSRSTFSSANNLSSMHSLNRVTSGNGISSGTMSSGGGRFNATSPHNNHSMPTQHHPRHSITSSTSSDQNHNSNTSRHKDSDQSDNLEGLQRSPDNKSRSKSEDVNQTAGLSTGFGGSGSEKLGATLHTSTSMESLISLSSKAPTVERLLAANTANNTAVNRRMSRNSVQSGTLSPLSTDRRRHSSDPTDQPQQTANQVSGKRNDMLSLQQLLETVKAKSVKTMEVLEKLLDASFIDEILENTHHVKESNKVALSTLDDLLTFDKLDEGKLRIEIDDLNPWKFVRETARPFEINAKIAEVNFSVSCENEDSRWTDKYVIKADKFKLSQVVRNLISNALKFTPTNGQVKVVIEKIQTYSTTRNGALRDTLRVNVMDSGAGISKENQKKLFGQYVQFNAAALQQGKGSGLGLWITKNIVELHRGTIKVHSEGEGTGCTFYFEIPLYKKAKRKSRLHHRNTAATATAAAALNSRISNSNLLNATGGPNSSRGVSRHGSGGNNIYTVGSGDTRDNGSVMGDMVVPFNAPGGSSSRSLNSSRKHSRENNNNGGNSNNHSNNNSNNSSNNSNIVDNRVMTLMETITSGPNSNEATQMTTVNSSLEALLASCSDDEGDLIKRANELNGEEREAIAMQLLQMHLKAPAYPTSSIGKLKNSVLKSSFGIMDNSYMDGQYSTNKNSSVNSENEGRHLTANSLMFLNTPIEFWDRKTVSHSPHLTFNELDEHTLSGHSQDGDSSNTPDNSLPSRRSDQMNRDRLFSNESTVSNDENYDPVGYTVINRSASSHHSNVVRQSAGVVNVYFGDVSYDEDDDHRLADRSGGGIDLRSGAFSPVGLTLDNEQHTGQQQQHHNNHNDSDGLVDISALMDRDDDLGVSSMKYQKPASPLPNSTNNSNNNNTSDSSIQGPVSVNLNALSMEDAITPRTPRTAAPSSRSPSGKHQPFTPPEHQITRSAIATMNIHNLSVNIPNISAQQTQTQQQQQQLTAAQFKPQQKQSYDTISREVSMQLSNSNIVASPTDSPGQNSSSSSSNKNTNSYRSTFTRNSNVNNSIYNNSNYNSSNNNSNVNYTSNADNSLENNDSNYCMSHNTSQSDIRSLPSFYDATEVSPRRRTISNTTLSLVGAASRKYIIDENNAKFEQTNGANAGNRTNNSSMLSMSPEIGGVSPTEARIKRHSFGGLSSRGSSDLSGSDSGSPSSENRMKRASFNAFTGMSFYKQRIVPINSSGLQPVTTVAEPSPIVSGHNTPDHHSVNGGGGSMHTASLGTPQGSRSNIHITVPAVDLTGIGGGIAEGKYEDKSEESGREHKNNSLRRTSVNRNTDESSYGSSLGFSGAAAGADGNVRKNSIYLSEGDDFDGKSDDDEAIGDAGAMQEQDEDDRSITPVNTTPAILGKGILNQIANLASMLTGSHSPAHKSGQNTPQSHNRKHSDAEHSGHHSGHRSSHNNINPPPLTINASTRSNNSSSGGNNTNQSSFVTTTSSFDVTAFQSDVAAAQKGDNNGNAATGSISNSNISRPGLDTTKTTNLYYKPSNYNITSSSGGVNSKNTNAPRHTVNGHSPPSAGIANASPKQSRVSPTNLNLSLSIPQEGSETDSSPLGVGGKSLFADRGPDRGLDHELNTTPPAVHQPAINNTVSEDSVNTQAMYEGNRRHSGAFRNSVTSSATSSNGGSPLERSPKAHSPKGRKGFSTWESGLAILIVDDSATNRKMTNKMLTRKGHTCVEAVDGLHFLSLINIGHSDKHPKGVGSSVTGAGLTSSSFSAATDTVTAGHAQLMHMGTTRSSMSAVPSNSSSNHSMTLSSSAVAYDLVLMDDNMPNMSGPEATQFARSHGYTGAIMAVTGNVYPEDVKRFLAMGANHVFPKPLDLDALQAKWSEMNDL